MYVNVDFHLKLSKEDVMVMVITIEMTLVILIMTMIDIIMAVKIIT
jgi:hypothetical protein